MGQRFCAGGDKCAWILLDFYQQTSPLMLSGNVWPWLCPETSPSGAWSSRGRHVLVTPSFCMVGCHLSFCSGVISPGLNHSKPTVNWLLPPLMGCSSVLQILRRRQPDGPARSPPNHQEPRPTRPDLLARKLKTRNNCLDSCCFQLFYALTRRHCALECT